MLSSLLALAEEENARSLFREGVPKHCPTLLSLVLMGRSCLC